MHPHHHRAILHAACFLALALATRAGASTVEADVAAALRRGEEFLWRQQADDGGWHGTTYGLLKSGQSLTPLVLQFIARIPPERSVLSADERERRIDRAHAFMAANAAKDGAAGMADPVLRDYPTYATALSLIALCRLNRAADAPAREKLAACLLDWQFSEANGWAPEHTAHGAWGMGGAAPAPPNTGHVDLSMTRYALQALRAFGLSDDHPAFARARIFLKRCQNVEDAGGDGGFIYSPVIVDANKAGKDGPRYRSYGTATADGFLALRAAGAPVDDPRCRQSAAWLRDRHDAENVPGFPAPLAEPWRKGMRYYYASAASTVLDPTGPWREPLARALMGQQREDGSWKNEGFIMKEDEAMIATVFALEALMNENGP